MPMAATAAPPTTSTSGSSRGASAWTAWATATASRTSTSTSHRLAGVSLGAHAHLRADPARPTAAATFLRTTYTTNMHFFIEPPPTFRQGSSPQKLSAATRCPTTATTTCRQRGAGRSGLVRLRGRRRPGWLDCLNQQLGVLGVTEDPRLRRPRLRVRRGRTACPRPPHLRRRVVGYEIMPSLSTGPGSASTSRSPTSRRILSKSARGAVEATGHHPTHIAASGHRKISLNLC